MILRFLDWGFLKSFDVNYSVLYSDLQEKERSKDERQRTKFHLNFKRFTVKHLNTGNYSFPVTSSAVEMLLPLLRSHFYSASTALSMTRSVLPRKTSEIKNKQAQMILRKTVLHLLSLFFFLTCITACYCIFI